MSKKTVRIAGILGGMGPEATARFFELVVKNTDAACDQDHLKVIVCNWPQIPDRTGAILYGGENPVPLMIEGLKVLERAGAELVAIPCMTAHHFLPELRKRTRLRLLDLVAATASWTESNLPEAKTVGLLATEGTVATGLFQKAFRRRTMKIILPTPKSQQKIMEAIYGKNGIKAGFGAGRPARLLRESAQELVEAGARAIIAGCTEIPLALKPDRLPVPLIDPMTIGARELIRQAGGCLRKMPVS
ncbi:MAG: Aspartate racemase [Candidatus Saccharicenans subterraneus]|uniref:Aspartate racemase n=1 Tax=Candidatus Saccharicenans subterraneus TaxID=2508984 RepID=A0A3E2BPV7_9BACT|nr:MAG: Aspartate racemase [Candidatus Saccharicenans subterraneum]